MIPYFMVSLVTGGLGFIGSHIVDKLLQLGHSVIVVDDESSGSYRNERAKHYKLDVLNYDALSYVFAKEKPDWVFHLAAESRIGPSIENPMRASDVNFMGTCVVLQLSREYGVKRFMLSSTSAAYGLQPPPHHEELNSDCLNPYSVSKVAAEKLAAMYYTLYGLETVIFRYFNVYGDRAPSEGQYSPVVSLFLRQKKSGPMTITGDGKQRRDFVHVSDVVEANIFAATRDLPDYAKRQVFGKVVNIGSGKNYGILEIAEMIGGDYEFIPKREGEAKETLADVAKAKNFLGWNPKVDFKKWIETQK